MRPEDLEGLKARREEIITIADNIKAKMRRLAEDKEDVVREIKGLDRVIHDAFYAKLEPDAAVEFVEWIDTVMNEARIWG